MPYSSRSRYSTSRPKRKYVKRNMSRTLKTSNYTASQKMNIRTMGTVGLELKYRDNGTRMSQQQLKVIGPIEQRSNVTASELSYYVTGIAQGSSFNERNGRAATLKNIHLWGTVSSYSFASFRVRVLLIQDTQTNGTSCVASDFLSPVNAGYGAPELGDRVISIESPPRIETQKRFKFLYDKTTVHHPTGCLTFTAEGNSLSSDQHSYVMNWEIKKKLNVVSNYVNVNDSQLGVPNIADNSMFLAVIVEAAQPNRPGASDIYDIDSYYRLRFLG